VALVIHDSSTWGSGITTTCQTGRSCVAWGVEILKVDLQGFEFLPNIKFVPTLLDGITGKYTASLRIEAPVLTWEVRGQ
jgi:hypothetical protein